MPSLLTVTDLFPWITLGIALLIGVLVGAERETARTLSGIGLRDIVLTAAVGWIAGRLHEPMMGIALFAGLVALMIMQRPRAPMLARHQRDFPISLLIALPPFQLDDVLEPQPFRERGHAPRHHAQFGMGQLLE